jgi:hypothetical protein
MLVGVFVFQQSAGKEKIDGRQARGDRMPRTCHLQRGQPQCRQSIGDGVHANFGIEQDIGLVGDDLAQPRRHRSGALHEAFDPADCPGRRFVGFRLGVVKEDLEALAIQTVDHPPQQHIPHRMTANMGADHTDADSIPCGRLFAGESTTILPICLRRG